MSNQAATISEITTAFTEGASDVTSSQTTAIFIALVFGVLLAFGLSIVFKKSEEVHKSEDFRELGKIILIVVIAIALVLIYAIVAAIT